MPIELRKFERELNLEENCISNVNDSQNNKMDSGHKIPLEVE
jgi:hypothetical protein